jgi:hypothetical protein
MSNEVLGSGTGVHTANTLSPSDDPESNPGLKLPERMTATSPPPPELITADEPITLD